MDIKQNVVVLMPYVKKNILLQLRDDIPGIVYPGCWGFFSGSIDRGEEPIDAANRELWEELQLRAPLTLLTEDIVPDIGHVTSYAYLFPLEDMTSLQLQEGRDLGLFTVEQVRSGKLFSSRFQRDFPVAPTPYIPKTIGKMIDFLVKQ